MLGLPSFVVVLILPGWLFQRMVAMEMDGIGPFFLALFIAIWIGFIGGIFGALAVRRLRGPTPARRGRAGAVWATVGSRGLLMMVGGVLGSVALARGGVEGGDPEFLLPRWIAGVVLTVLISGEYVRSRMRSLKQTPRGRGWWLFAGGLVLHLLLIASVPVSLFQAWVTFRPEITRGGGQNRRYEGPQEPGLFAQRSLRLQQPESQQATVVVRLWDQGRPRELERRVIRGSTSLEWRLIEGPAPDRALSLKWSQPAATAAEAKPLGLPSGLDLSAVIEPGSIRLEPGAKRRLWIFQDFNQTTSMPAVATPDGAVEVVLEANLSP